MIILKSLNAENVKRGPFGLFKHSMLQNIPGPFEDINKSSKKVTVPKNTKGGPSVSSGFACYVKNKINKRRTLCTNLDAFPLPGPVA